MTLSGPGSSVATALEFKDVSRSSGSTSLPLLELWIRIPQPRQISRARARVQFFEQRIIPPLAGELRHSAVRVVQIAEHDRLRRTSLLAGCHDLSILDGPALFFGLDLHRVDAR